MAKASSNGAPEAKPRWTGFEDDETEIAPLTPETFVQRLATMTAFNRDLYEMRQAMKVATGDADKPT